MSHTGLIALVLLAALNLVAAAVGVSQQSKAAPDTMNYEQLIKNRNFARAVKSIIETCRVDVDIGKVLCSPPAGKG